MTSWLFFTADNGNLAVQFTVTSLIWKQEQKETFISFASKC